MTIISISLFSEKQWCFKSHSFEMMLVYELLKCEPLYHLSYSSAVNGRLELLALQHLKSLLANICETSVGAHLEPFTHYCM